MHAALVAAKALIVVLGLLIAYVGYRGYRRNDSQPMLFLAAGFGFVTVGSVCESVLFDMAGLSLFTSGMTQATIIAVGMASILYSLFGHPSV